MRIFISYAHKDGANLALRVHADLTNKGFDVWLDRSRLRAGAVWSREVDTCEIVIALLPPGPVASPNAETFSPFDEADASGPFRAEKASVEAS